ncbi:glutamate racemase [Psychrobacter sp. UBA3962]|uniref:glutamate racemase n=1 Tax=Psychrobacter sp. UBA3962 TaxID=1947352 RepID=UPI0025DA544E|nr:glutamate racemase [Psychrobacter sp. UBA3962]
MATQAITLPISSLINTDSAPIGIFDSGVGGLSVYLHLKQQLPDEQYLYYADTLNVPYGPRSSTEIKELTLIAVDWLVAAGCKLIVIACNSASAHALQIVRHKYPTIPIVGLVPALKPAVLNSSSKSVAVLATKATLDGELLNTVISDYALPAQVNVVKWFDPSLVPWVEAGMPTLSETPERLKAQLKSFAQQKVDHLVLGCTHYPFFREFVMAQIADEDLGIKVVDSGAAIAARVKTLLQQSQSLAVVKQTNTAEASLYIGHSNQAREELDLAQSKLAFFVSDPKADLAEVSKLVSRLIYR